MIGEPGAQKLKTQGRFPVLDALRIFLAFWVTMAHFGVFPLFAGVDTATRFGRNLVHGWSSIVWGNPAVIGFFVISGFCIHLPFRNVEHLSIGRYYARRYIRILVPVSAAIAITQLTGDRQTIFGKHDVLWSGVLWSLFCEEIYYGVYPMARWIRRRFGWTILLVPAFLLAEILAVICRNALNGSLLGAVEAAAILFPVWLLGCVLGEQSDRLPAVDSAWVIWGWRFLAWLGSWLCEMLHFKYGITRPQVLLCFGVLAYLWIRKEIEYSKLHPAWAPLVSAGLWSYSLYLMHIPAIMLFKNLALPSFGYNLNWCTNIAFIMAASYLFYRCVERPSHRLARKFRAIAKPESRSTLQENTAGKEIGSTAQGSCVMNP
jgi:peptidoglycan/LPS O-acetylase OafA/YrhL